MILVKVVIFIALKSLVRPCESSRILAIMPTPSYSHQIVFNPLWLTLNSRGHHITLLTTDPINNPNLTNFRQIDWSIAYTIWHQKHNVSTIIRNFKTNLIQCLKQYVDMMENIFIEELQHPKVKDLLSDSNEHFDLVIVEMLNPLMIAFSRRFNCPFIGVSSMDLTNFIHEGLSNPVSPALYPDFLSPFVQQMSFSERLMNTFYYLGTKLYFKFYLYPRLDQIIKNSFGEDTPKLEEMQRNASMIFLNVNPLIHNVRPLMSNVLMIGGGTHFEQSTTLPTDIQNFLNEAEEGAIYFSLGTNAKSKDLSEETLSTFLEVFSELPYRVLWKFEDSSIATNPNLMIKQWLPQQQILKHPNVRLFITQGGLQSVEEAIFYGIPIIGIPFFLDQFPNVKKVVGKGMGIMLDCTNVEKSVLKNAISEIIKDPKYKRAALNLSVLLKEQPISGITQAVWWTEYVLKHKGAKFLKPPEIPLYQYLLFDVMISVFLVTTVLTFSMYFSFKLLIRVLKKRRRSKLIKLE